MLISVLARATALLALAVSAWSANAGLAMPEQSGGGTPLSSQILRQDVIINADIWAQKPEMMAAGLGFTSILGVPNLSTSDVALSKTLTVLADGTWNNVRCANGQTPPLSSHTSASTPSGVRSYYGEDVYYSDGLPVEFSWPILPVREIAAVQTVDRHLKRLEDTARLLTTAHAACSVRLERPSNERC
jgi:hypothetical protein